MTPVTVLEIGKPRGIDPPLAARLVRHRCGGWASSWNLCVSGGSFQPCSGVVGFSGGIGPRAK